MSDNRREAWKLSKRELMQAVHMGMGKDEIEALEEKRHQTYIVQRERSLEKAGMTEEELLEYFSSRYGFEHECHCFEDQFTGDGLVNTTLCEIEVKAKALEHLEKVNLERDELAENLANVRRQVMELGEEPVA